MVGFHDWLAECAEEVDTHIDSAFSNTFEDFPGCWAYEVPENVGAFILELSTSPDATPEDVAKYAVKFTRAWIAANGGKFQGLETEVRRVEVFDGVCESYPLTSNTHIATVGLDYYGVYYRSLDSGLQYHYKDFPATIEGFLCVCTYVPSG